MHLKEASRHLPDLRRRLLALLAARPDVVVVPEPVALVELALAALGPHLDLDRRRPRDALRVARVAVAEHHPESQTTGPRFNRRLDDPLNNPTNHPSNHPTKGLFSTGGKSPFYF